MEAGEDAPLYTFQLAQAKAKSVFDTDDKANRDGIHCLVFCLGSLIRVCSTTSLLRWATSLQSS